jgi:LPPG:FO 2-phospho-L-lactate transferase
MKVTVLTGGVGGAKLVLGLTHIMPHEDITAIINTGDDFVHLGLPISPDIDTLLYTLSGKSNTTQGWGREGESWNFMAALKSLGGSDWFNLGDGDLALHVMRLAGGTKSQTTVRFADQWGVKVLMLPMSDDPVATMLDTDIGRLAFQSYFVEHRCAPIVRRVVFEGAAAARPAPAVISAISCADIILIAPSNPWLSVDPILAVPGIAEALKAARAPVVAVSPLVGGKAVKGPTAKLMEELGLPINNASIAEHYRGLLDGLLINTGDDAPEITHADVDTLMHSLEDRARVAAAALRLAKSLSQT